MPRIDAAIAIVTRQRKLLICQRKPDDHLGGFWEFPGGKCEDGETLQQCIRRELLEEVNIHARPTRQLAPIEHDYPYGQVRLHPFICEYESGEEQLLECQAALWIDPDQLRAYEFPPANERLIEEVIEYFASAAIDYPPIDS
jgi:mutator protein MutT